MKIRSNKISREDIMDAAHVIPGVLHKVRDEFKPRNFNFGYDVVLFSSRLTGHASAGMPGWKAATWQEFGIFIDQLFAIDPDAHIAGYNGRENFIEQTSIAVAHEERRTGKIVSARWLTPEQRREGRDLLECQAESRLYMARVQ